MPVEVIATLVRCFYGEVEHVDYTIAVWVVGEWYALIVSTSTITLLVAPSVWKV